MDEGVVIGKDKPTAFQQHDWICSIVLRKKKKKHHFPMENRRKLHLTIKLWIRDFEHPEVLGSIRI